MDVYDSPLNKAHQQARRAESCLAKGKYSEAIDCHHRAADHLSELTSEKLSSTEAVKSILLQQDYHTRQIAIIQDKLQNFILFAEPDSLSTALEDQLQVGNALLNRPVYLPYDTMDNRHDTMLQYVLTKDPGGASDPVETDYIVKATKKQKDDKTIIEEQQITINSLRIHIQELHREADQLKEHLAQERNKVHVLQRLNDQLSSKVAAYEAVRVKEEGHSVDRMNILDVDGNSIELPPLEIPKFDFELLSAAQADDDSSAT